MDGVSEICTRVRRKTGQQRPRTAAGRGTSGYTGRALHEALLGGHEGLVNDLLEGGAFIAVSDRNSRTPLHVTALEGKSEMAQLLILKGADKDASDGSGRTPLYHAVLGRHVDAARALVAAGADRKRFSPIELVLHAATRLDTVEMLRALIAHGADVKATLPNNPEGRTALHTAATRNDVPAIDLLVDAGGDVGARNRGGATPLHCAALNSSLEASMTLLMHGADVNAQTRQRETPLHWVAEAAGEEEAGGGKLSEVGRLEAQRSRGLRAISRCCLWLCMSWGLDALLRSHLGTVHSGVSRSRCMFLPEGRCFLWGSLSWMFTRVRYAETLIWRVSARSCLRLLLSAPHLPLSRDRVFVDIFFPLVPSHVAGLSGGILRRYPYVLPGYPLLFRLMHRGPRSYQHSMGHG